MSSQRPVYMASQFYGAGQVFYIGSGEMWRLRTRRPGLLRSALHEADSPREPGPHPPRLVARRRCWSNAIATSWAKRSCCGPACPTRSTSRSTDESVTAQLLRPGRHDRAGQAHGRSRPARHVRRPGDRAAGRHVPGRACRPRQRTKNRSADTCKFACPIWSAPTPSETTRCSRRSPRKPAAFTTRKLDAAIHGDDAT